MRRTLLMCVLALLAGGCALAPRERLSFPAIPIGHDAGATWYDVDHNGRPDFAVTADGRLLYDDDEDGTADRTYRLSDYSNEDVPQVVILLDSIPFEIAQDRYAAGDFPFFAPPQKMISAFPSLTEVCYTEILDAPPLPAVIDTQYDPRLGEHRSDVWKRVVDGYQQPWERRLTYSAGYGETGLSFLDPRQWCAAEFSRCKRAIDDSPRRTTIVYVSSAAAMVCKFGRDGANEVLDGARQLCLQLLYERRGAIKISMMADHGHNLVPSTNVDLVRLLTADGFRVTDAVTSPDEVVISINGLVTNALLQTARPAPVAAALVKHEPIELAMYQAGDRVIVQSKGGRAEIECQNDKFRYAAIGADVLGYAETLKLLPTDADGFADEAAWFRATVDHRWPNAPARLWHAFHRQTVTPPSVMLSFKDGFYCGKPEYERFIKMASTHGGLNQINSATFVMTMTGRLHGPVLPRDVMRTLLPGQTLQVVR